MDRVVTDWCEHSIVRIVLCILALTTADLVVAGPVPRPIEARLDVASRVVVGLIINVEEPGIDRGDGVRLSRATVEVTEVLKGPACGSIGFRVVSFCPPNWGGSAILRIHRVGDSGIWVVGEDDAGLYAAELLREDQKEEVCRILQMLAERTWSPPINGLQAWAGVVRSYKVPVIIFAVRNVSDEDLFIPAESTAGFISALVIRPEGNTTAHSLGVVNDGSETLFCRRLSAGKTAYLHPRYSFIDLAWTEGLSPGEYSVVIACQNTRDGWAHGGAPAKLKEVVAWKGKVMAPPVQLSLGPSEASKERTQ